MSYLNTDMLCCLFWCLTSFFLLVSFFFLMCPPPPRSTLFPYTTLFRSRDRVHPPAARARARDPPVPTCTSRSGEDRKSTRLNSSHRCISYAVFCLKKKKIATTVSKIL